MNYWRILMAIAMVCVAGLVFTGCEIGGDDDEDPLVGTWEAVTIDGKPLPSGFSLTVVVNDNGTGSVTMASGDEKRRRNFTWSKGDGVLIIVEDGKAENTPYTLAGNTLTIITDGDTIVFNRRS